MLLLASYVLASSFAWVHTASHGPGGEAAPTAVQHSCCCAHHLTVPVSGIQSAQLRAAGTHRSGAPEHRHDECTLCRFQLAQKLIPFAPELVASTVVCPERADVEVPLVRVAALATTPDSRAPPAVT